MTFPFRVYVDWEQKQPATALGFSGNHFCIMYDDGSFDVVHVRRCKRLTKLEEHLAGE